MNMQFLLSSTAVHDRDIKKITKIKDKINEKDPPCLEMRRRLFVGDATLFQLILVFCC